MDDLIEFMAIKILVPLAMVLMLFLLFVMAPISIYQSYKEKQGCDKWERTMVNHPAHFSGKIHYPESVELEDICVNLKP